MINLAGVEKCDAYIREELEKAGIDIYNLVEPGQTEVPYTLFGAIGGEPMSESDKSFMKRRGLTIEIISKFSSFTFERAWTYWMVEGYVPLNIAVEMYADPNGVKDIRANGHCGCPPPSEQLVQHKVCGMDVVGGYHIDTQEGLNYFVETLKKHGLV